MTRTGRSPKLGARLPEPFVEVHPEDASKAGLIDGGLARVSTEHGACLVKVVVSDAQRSGSLFVPIHWSSETASSACVGDLVSAQTDPHSGQPEAKATPAAIAPVVRAHRGFVRTRRAIALPQSTWWTRVAVADGMEYRLATNDGLLLWHDFAYQLLTHDARLAEHLDGSRGIYRAAAIVDGERESSLCIGPDGASLSVDMFEALLPGDGQDSADLRLLQMRGEAADFGEREQVVCACFGTGLNAIREVVASGRASNVAEIGQALRAGTNCGSCLPELRRISSLMNASRSPSEAPPPRMARLSRLPVFFTLEGKRALVAAEAPRPPGKRNCSPQPAPRSMSMPESRRRNLWYLLPPRRVARSRFIAGLMTTAILQAPPLRSAPSIPTRKPHASQLSHALRASPSTSWTSRLIAISPSARSSIARRSSSAFRPTARRRSSPRRSAPSSRR